MRPVHVLNARAKQPANVNGEYAASHDRDLQHEKRAHERVEERGGGVRMQ